MSRRLIFHFFLFLCLAETLPAQDFSSYPVLPRYRFRDGEETLRAFAPISAQTRSSVVEVNVDGEAVALGTIVDSSGLALTKASEIKPGKLTCWLATGKEVPAQVLATDDDDDVALLRVQAKGLKPVQWTSEILTLGQWAITPGLADTPQAAGIISAVPRRIRPERAFIGVVFSRRGQSIPEVEAVDPDLGAAKAGVQTGDIITAVDKTPVTNSQQVVEIISNFREGQTIRLAIERGDKEIQTSVKLMVPRTGPFAMDLYLEQEENRLSGDLSTRSQGFEQAIEHDTVLEPWLCGGPLMDLDGKAIGLNIARASRVATYALPAKLVKQIFQTLKSTEQQTGKTLSSGGQ